MKFPKIYNTYFVAFVATVGGMLFGFDISSMSAIIGTTQYNDYFDSSHGLRQGAIGSALAAGSVVGSVIAGPISNWIGRRDSIFFACLWWLLGTAVQTGTNGFGMLIAGRVLNGVCVGITSSQVPVYLAEIAKKEKRGAVVIIQQLAIGETHPRCFQDLFANARYRVGNLHHVFHRLRLPEEPRWTSCFPCRLGNPVYPLRLPDVRITIPP
jgi:hypothetical protein